MFTYQNNNTDFYCGDATMNNISDHWYHEQNEFEENYQTSPVVETTTNGYNQNGCMVEHTGYPQHSQYVVPNQYSGANHEVNDYHNYSLPQNSDQFIPVPVIASQRNYPAYLPFRPHQINTSQVKNHRAMITIIPTKTGTFKTIVKRKRKRTIFTTEQVEALEEIFKRKQYITREDRNEIGIQLNINDKAVKIWFQNRRLKDKKGPEQTEEDLTTFEERCSLNAACLDEVEFKIREKTNEFGYVTLDDGIMKDLFNVIVDVFWNPNPMYSQHNKVTESDGCPTDSSESDDNPMYEPISPASFSDRHDEDSTSSWQPSEPNESLQRLLDIQDLLSR